MAVACRRLDMPKEILFLVEESPDGGFEARAPGFSIYTQGETIDEVKKMAVDAVRCHFDGEEVPSLIRLHTVKEEVVAV
jgi:predicted RNase H-like HicB family nuclease